jgi:peroxiredoxin
MNDMGGNFLQQAEQLLKSGNRQAALPILTEYLRQNPGSERAWWMLSFAINDSKKQLECVRRVLQINPQNSAALARLEKLKGGSFASKSASSHSNRSGRILQYAVLSIMGCVMAGLLGYSTFMFTQRYNAAPRQPAEATSTFVEQLSMPATWTPTPTASLVPTHTLNAPLTSIIQTFTPNPFIATETLVPKSKVGPYKGYYGPSFGLTDVHTQKTVHLSDYEGKSVVIYFWATWCAICKTEMPSMEATYKGYRDEGLVFLAVDVGESAAQAREYADALGLTFPVLDDSNKSVASKYEIVGFPTFYFIEPSGVISSVRIGGMDYWSFNTRVRQLLKLE